MMKISYCYVGMDMVLFRVCLRLCLRNIFFFVFFFFLILDKSVIVKLLSKVRFRPLKVLSIFFISNDTFYI
jgi:hypothetical protein